MAAKFTPRAGVRVLTTVVRVLALIEAADAVYYLSDAGWFSANGLLIALTAAGLVGAALTWTQRRPVVVGVGGLLVVIAPAVVYPLSALLLVATLALIGLSILPAARRAPDAPIGGRTAEMPQGA